MFQSSGEFYYHCVVAFSYYAILVSLFIFARNARILAILQNEIATIKSKGVISRSFVLMLLLKKFILLCGVSHTLFALETVFPHDERLDTASNIILLLYAITAFVSMIALSVTLPQMVRSLENMKLNDEGLFEHADSYLIEIVNVLKESIVVLSHDTVILRGNNISSTLFGPDFIGQNVQAKIHHEDLAKFQGAMKEITSNDTGSRTIEYRVRNETTATVVDPYLPNAPDYSEYTWVESTFCKGNASFSTSASSKYEFHVKMISRNVNHRKKDSLFKQYFETAKEQERVNEGKLRYISCIAHDLKTPLQSFCFTVDLLQQTELTADQAELVSHTAIAVDLMKLTISQTMDISKALTGAKLQPRRGSVQLSSIIQRVSIIINGYGKQVPVTFEVMDGVHDGIITDEEWLWQMLLNLLTNACKYTATGSIRVVVSLVRGASSEKTLSYSSLRASSVAPLPAMTVSTAPSNIMFEVIDTGVGIRNDKLGSVFDAFSQVQEGQVTGTGLGLFGVRTRAEGLLGTCGARHNTESSTGTGTVMWFAIPYVEDKNSSSPLSAPAFSPTHAANGGMVPWPLATSALPAVSPTASGLGLLRSKPLATPLATTPAGTSALTQLIREHRLTAMVVDDTLTIRRLMERMLLQMGFASVVCYENGSKGLDAMMAAPVDIVFSDVMMPIMTGPEMVRRFRLHEAAMLSSSALFPIQPQPRARQLIVAVSANVAEFDASLGDGFDCVCPKPLSRRDLSSVVMGYLTDKAKSGE